MNDKVISMLSLAKKAGRLISGEEMVIDFIRSGKKGIVIVTADASDNTKKLFHDKCKYYHVPIYEYGTRLDLGHVSMAVSDKNFAESIRKLLD